MTAPFVSIHGRRFGLVPGGLMVDGNALFPSVNVPGNIWYVDAKNGDDGRDGVSWDTSVQTMEEVLTRLKSNDIIVGQGKVLEQVVSPAGVFDVTIIGAAPSPRHADNHTESAGKRGSSAFSWAAPASGSTAAALLRVQQQGWNFRNIVFQISGSATACVEQFKNGESGDDERDGGHARFFDCRFVGSGVGGIGAYRNGGNGYCQYVRCGFQSLTAGIGHVAGDGGQDGFQLIEDCWFENNTKHIDSPLYRSRVLRNMFLATASGNIEVDLTGGAGNIVTGNHFLGAGFEENIAGTGDSWFDNYSVDTTSADVADAAAAGAGQIIATPNGS